MSAALVRRRTRVWLPVLHGLVRLLSLAVLLSLTMLGAAMPAPAHGQVLANVQTSTDVPAAPDVQTPASGSRPDTPLARLDTTLAPLDGLRLHRSAVGVTRRGTPIPCFIAPDDFDPLTDKRRLLLIGGARGDDGSTEAVVAALRWFHTSPAAAEYRERFTLSAVACLNPDGYAAYKQDANLSGGNPARGYPPKNTGYQDPAVPEVEYLWRWVGLHAPDLVLVAGDSPEADDTLLAALPRHAAAGTGTIATRAAKDPLATLHKVLAEAKVEVSAARREVERRLRRTPLEVARQLEPHYGHELNQVVYIPALAVWGRLRLGELEGKSRLDDIAPLVARYRDGAPTYRSTPTGSHLAGHLLFGHLATLTGDERYTRLVQRVADLGFDALGEPRASMPAHEEMSDAVFMSCPLLAQAGRLTGESRYFEQCVRHLQFMQRLTLRDDGLYRHWPLEATAWGRGNGFPALGLALAISEMPRDTPQRTILANALRDQLRALKPFQEPDGCWHQIIDRPASYRELTATCMITFAMARGVAQGVLDADEFAKPIERGWQAIQTRVAADGSLVDVCTGTSKQRSERDYYDRQAILGPDGRGGGVVLLVATEIEAYRRSR